MSLFTIQGRECGSLPLLWVLRDDRRDLFRTPLRSMIFPAQRQQRTAPRRVVIAIRLPSFAQPMVSMAQTLWMWGTMTPIWSCWRRAFSRAWSGQDRRQFRASRIFNAARACARGSGGTWSVRCFAQCICRRHDPLQNSPEQELTSLERFDACCFPKPVAATILSGSTAAEFVSGLTARRYFVWPRSPASAHVPRSVLHLGRT